MPLVFSSLLSIAGVVTRFAAFIYGIFYTVFGYWLAKGAKVMGVLWVYIAGAVAAALGLYVAVDSVITSLSPDLPAGASFALSLLPSNFNACMSSCVAVDIACWMYRLNTTIFGRAAQIAASS